MPLFLSLAHSHSSHLLLDHMCCCQSNTSWCKWRGSRGKNWGLLKSQSGVGVGCERTLRALYKNLWLIRTEQQNTFESAVLMCRHTWIHPTVSRFCWSWNPNSSSTFSMSQKSGPADCFGITTWVSTNSLWVWEIHTFRENLYRFCFLALLNIFPCYPKTHQPSTEDTAGFYSSGRVGIGQQEEPMRQISGNHHPPQTLHPLICTDEINSHWSLRTLFMITCLRFALQFLRNKHQRFENSLWVWPSLASDRFN